MMCRFVLITIYTLFGSVFAKAQIFWGENAYTEYRQGVLPIVISVPHGGSLQPENIPDRTCNNAVTVTDAHTVDLALKLDAALFALTNCHPHLVICHLKRTKLDCNRNVNDGACGNNDAITAWNEFHDFIEQAQSIALSEHGERVFYIDLHGHGNPTQRIELGYLLYEDELELSDATLNSAQYVGYSSIQNLVGTNINGFSHTDLLRGDFALGTLLADNGFPAVPSQQDPVPGIGSNYFSGGYNTLNHSSYAPGNLVDGVQMECNYDGVRDTELNRTSFAATLADVLNNFLEKHHGLSISNGSCGIAGISEHLTGVRNTSAVVNSAEMASFLNRYSNMEWKIFSCSGALVSQEGANYSAVKLGVGTYFMQINDPNEGIRSFRLLVHE